MGDWNDIKASFACLQQLTLMVVIAAIVRLRELGGKEGVVYNVAQAIAKSHPAMLLLLI